MAATMTTAPLFASPILSVPAETRIELGIRQPEIAQPDRAVSGESAPPRLMPIAAGDRLLLETDEAGPGVDHADWFRRSP